MVSGSGAAPAPLKGCRALAAERTRSRGTRLLTRGFGQRGAARKLLRVCVGCTFLVIEPGSPIYHLKLNHSEASARDSGATSETGQIQRVSRTRSHRPRRSAAVAAPVRRAPCARRRRRRRRRSRAATRKASTRRRRSGSGSRWAAWPRCPPKTRRRSRRSSTKSPSRSGASSRRRTSRWRTGRASTTSTASSSSRRGRADGRSSTVRAWRCV